jgi:hypothetical protein
MGGMKRLKIKTDTSLNGMGSADFDYRNDKHQNDFSANDDISWNSSANNSRGIQMNRRRVMSAQTLNDVNDLKSLS